MDSTNRVQDETHTHEEEQKDENANELIDQMLISQDEAFDLPKIIHPVDNQTQEAEREERVPTPHSPPIDASLIKSQEFKSMESEPIDLGMNESQIPHVDHLTLSQEGFFNVKNDDLHNTNESKIEETHEFTKEDLPNLEFIPPGAREDEFEMISKNDAVGYESTTKEKPRETFVDMLGNGSLTKTVINFGVESKRPLNGQICSISYSTFLESGTLIDRQEDFEFILGDGDVIPALDMAVGLVELHEECEIFSESRHAFGEKGNPPDVPSNSNLKFNLKLNSIQEAPELYKLKPIERLSLAEAKKKRGNFLYNRQLFDTALNSYKKGLKYLNEHFFGSGDNVVESREDMDKILELKVILLMNVALANFKLTNYKEALETLDDLLRYQPKHMKALFTKGKILAQCGELAEAIKHFNKALILDDKNTDIKKELTKAQAKYQVEHEKEKQMYKKMITGVGKKSETLTSNTTTSPKQADFKSKTKKLEKDDNKLLSYLTAAGIFIAIAGIGFAAYNKYKNAI